MTFAWSCDLIDRDANTGFYCEAREGGRRIPITSDQASLLLSAGKAFQIWAQENLVILRLKAHA